MIILIGIKLKMKIRFESKLTGVFEKITGPSKQREVGICLRNNIVYHCSKNKFAHKKSRPLLSLLSLHFYNVLNNYVSRIVVR